MDKTLSLQLLMYLKRVFKTGQRGSYCRDHPTVAFVCLYIKLYPYFTLKSRSPRYSYVILKVGIIACDVFTNTYSE